MRFVEGLTTLVNAMGNPSTLFKEVEALGFQAPGHRNYQFLGPNMSKYHKAHQSTDVLLKFKYGPEALASLLVSFLWPVSQSTNFQGIRAGFFRESLMDTIDDQLAGQVSMLARAGLHCLLNYAGSNN